MANHITNLTNRVADGLDTIARLEAEEVARRDRVTEFQIHLQSTKFQGAESDGTLRSTIQVGDVHRWLDYIERGN